jgi:DUF4097 and DUF4098 domain-containing protein YvlB
MKEELKRIMKLVQEGKLSPDDAAELIEAFQSAPAAPESETESTGQPKRDDPFGGLIESIERIGKDVAKSVNWSDVSAQIREGARKGVEVVREAAEQARRGKGPFGFFTVAETTEVTLPISVPEGKILRIENHRGDVAVHGGAPAGSVTAVASFRGLTAEEAKARAETYTLVVEESEQALIIRQPDESNLSVDLSVRVPGPTPLEISADSGDVQVSDSGAGVRLVGRNGDVRLSGVAGVVEIETANGDVTVIGSEVASLSVEGKTGAVRLDDVRGSITVRTAAGDVGLIACAGSSIAVEAVAGDVRVDLAEPLRGTLSVRSVNGNTRVSLPSGSDCRVALATLRGEVSCDLELADLARAEQRVTGRLGDGTGTLDVSAVTGDVHLTCRD